jgi:cell division protease FtsH
MTSLQNFYFGLSTVSLLVAVPVSLLPLLYIEPICYYIPFNLKKYYKKHNPSVKFSDIVGCDILKKELSIIINNQNNYGKGCIFTGPPGTGKTYMAKSIAGESKRPFIEIDLKACNISYLDIVLKKICKKYDNPIIYLDESDNIISYNSDFLLKWIDGIQNNEYKYFIIISTNCNLSKSLTRSGRIDRIFNFTNPNSDEREKYLLSSSNFENIDKIVKLTNNFSYADLKKLITEYELQSIITENKDELFIINNVVSRFLLKKSNTYNLYTNDDKLRIVYHELGHFITSKSLNSKINIERIVFEKNDPNTGAYNHFCDESIYHTKNYIIDLIIMYYGSKVYEKYFLKDTSTLFKGDFENIQKLWEMMVQCNIIFCEPKNEKKELDKFLNTIDDLIIDYLNDENIKNVIEEMKNHFLKYESIEKDDLVIFSEKIPLMKNGNYYDLLF